MEAEFGGKNQYLYGPVVSGMKKTVGNGKRSLEWDLNDWKWDGDLFTAQPLNSLPSDCRSRQFFPPHPEIPAKKANPSNDLSSSAINPGEGKKELEKRRRGVIGEGEGGGLNDEGGSLSLNLGGHGYPFMVEGEEKSGKKTKVIGTTTTAATTSNRAVCQVQDCTADLGNAKDYHRRHKVCDVHSKATMALVGNVMQRFCQQCSRFHVLQEFDEGKRSCRRRLAGHNRRRRKTHPDVTVVNEGSLNDGRGSSYLLTSLLRILTNLHTNGSDHTRNQDILSHLLRNLASLAAPNNGRALASLLEGSKGLLNARTPGGAHEEPNLNSNTPEASRRSGSSIKIDNGFISQDPPISMAQCETGPTNGRTQKCIPSGDGGVENSKPLPGAPFSSINQSRGSLPCQLTAVETTLRRNNLNNVDLNNVYIDMQNTVENHKKPYPHVASQMGSIDLPSWLQCDSLKSSPPQASRNSDSTSNQSPSSSSGEAQSRTDRIVFKLFGKDPNDFPLLLRSQILNWLSHSPTEIESYIRPGCIILTIYLHLEKSAWEELYCNLGSSLRKLLGESNDTFWRTGWVFARVQQSVAFLYNGQVVLDVPLCLKSPHRCTISCIKPLAVPASARAHFIVKGCNLSQSGTRLLCALEGKYLVHASCHDLIGGADESIQHLNFSCHIPNVTGRGFIEVEDHGLSSCSFPFIVAEKEVCSEICKLENVIEAAEATNDLQIKNQQMEEKTQALHFLQEMGWLLHRSRVKVRLGPMAPIHDLFQFNRISWLVDFSMDHGWCAVMKKLLDIMFEGGVDAGEQASIELALLDMSLLHKAVMRNSRPMVELLLRFVPVKTSDGADSEVKQVEKATHRFLFRPDTVGPAGLTPLHVAASMSGSEKVLDALTDDPGMVGIEVWKSARDSTGLTPNDYACLRGYYSYVQLVQNKTNKKGERLHVVDIPGTVVDSGNTKQKQSDGHRTGKVCTLQTEKIETIEMASQCRVCQQKLVYGGMRTAVVYRPVLLSMVAIAAVCVCVALLFKSSPRVYYVFQPFNWESLEYGTI